MNILDNNQEFKVNDKVRVLKFDGERWKTFYYGVIVQLGTKFAKILDYKVSDANLGTLNESSQWCPFESKTLKIIKD